VAFVKPEITALALLFYIELIATGVLEIVAAVPLREVIKDE
jgi:hypothetical protein